LWSDVRKLALELGAAKVGVADLALYRDDYGYASKLLRKFRRAISVAWRLSDPIIDAITPDDPTEAYVHHYRAVNQALDYTALRIASLLQRRGYRAMPIPASQSLGEERLYGAISHKAVAALAGLGWIGKSMLLVTEEWGPRVRLVTVLTDCPLEPGEPLECRCGSCRACVEACPAGAVRDVSFKLYPPPLYECFDARACSRRLKEIERNPRYGEEVCGVCVKVCPVGQEHR